MEHSHCLWPMEEWKGNASKSEQWNMLLEVIFMYMQLSALGLYMLQANILVKHHC